MFENIANFFQGHGWVSNAQLDAEKKKKAQAAAAAIDKLPVASRPASQSQPSPVSYNISSTGEQKKPLPSNVDKNAVNDIDIFNKSNTLKQQEYLSQFKKIANDPYDPKNSTAKYILENINMKPLVAMSNFGDETGRFLGDLTGAKNLVADAVAIGDKDAARSMITGVKKSTFEGLDKEGKDAVNRQAVVGGAFAPLQVGMSFASPLLAKGLSNTVTGLSGLGVREGARQLAKTTGKNVAIGNAIGDPLMFGAQNYVSTGNPLDFSQQTSGDILRTVGENSLFSALLPAGLGKTPNPSSVMRNNLLKAADDIEVTASKTPTSQLGRIDDGISSPIVAEAKRQNAADTANVLRRQADEIDVQPARTPEVDLQTRDIMSPQEPLTLRRATPEELNARASAGDQAAIDEINARFAEAQQGIDADTTAPIAAPPVSEVIDPVVPIDNRLESPTTARSREVAESVVPVSEEAVSAPVSEIDARMAADDVARQLGTPTTRKASELTSYEGAPDRARVDEYKQRIADGEQLDPVIVMRDSQGNLGIEDGKHRYQAYQEMGIEDIPTVERGAPQDAHISQLYKEAEGHLARADEILARDGSDVAQLGQKLYVADVNKTPAQLTPAEREALSYLNSNLDDAKRVLLSRGIIDEDLGSRGPDYLPTGDIDAIDTVMTPEDINASSFNYAKGRSGSFIKSDGTVSDKLPGGIRAAYTDYYVRGKGSQYLTDSKVDEIKTERITQTDLNDVMFGPADEPLTGLDGKPVKFDDAGFRKNAESVVTAERNFAKAVKSGDEKAVATAQKEVNQKTIDNSVDKLTQLKRTVNALIKETRESNLPRNQKTARIVELENRLEYARKQARYQQSYVKTNLLFQVPGRVADQVGKLTQSIGDALTAPLASQATRAFRPTTAEGRKAARTVARDSILNKRQNNYVLNRAINREGASTPLGRLAGEYTALGTRVSELGSRQSAPTLDTARYFAAQAEKNGAENITEYIRNAIGTKEWDRVFNQFSTNRNRFSGVGDITGSVRRGVPGVKKGFANEKLDDVKKWLNNSIDNAFATTLPRSVRRNMAEAISIPLVGFPRVVWNVGSKGMDYASFGMTSLYKASKVNVVDDATALQKALHLRDAIDGAAAGGGLVGLGVLLGQSDLITGSEPEKQANGEWVPPYSLKLGNDYVELGRFIGPYSVPIMIAAALSRGDSAKDIASIPALVTGQVLNNFGADSIGDTMSQMGDVLNGDWSGLAGKVPNMLAAFAPFSSEMNSIANAIDPYQRVTKDDDMFVRFVNQLIAKVPGLREQLDPKEDQFGNKVPSSPLKAVVPITTVGSGWGETELGKEANRLDLKPSGSSNTQDNAEDMAKRVMSSDWYKGLKDEDKKAALQSTLYSGKLGDINPELSDTSKNALAVGTLMDAKVREKWLESAANARDYHVAAYENATANGTLTARQDNLENSSSLHYKAVAAQVNATLPYWTATLEEQYKNTSRKELFAMDPSNPVRKALLALDEARAGVGASRKNGDHSATKYGSSGTGGGRKSFGFAPTSAVQVQKSGFTDPDIKSNWNTPLVKPLGVGEASKNVKRKISVSRGVSL